MSGQQNKNPQQTKPVADEAKQTQAAGAAGEQATEKTAEQTTAAPAVKQPEAKQETVAKQEPKQFVGKDLGMQNVLISYHEAMAVEQHVNPEEGGQYQFGLFTAIRAALNATEQSVFKAKWSTLLSYFNANAETIFNENFMFRFPEQWPGSSTEFAIFRRVVYVAIQTANPKTRAKALESIKLEKATEDMTEVQKNNFVTFYS